jgi:predicted outer membrane protein
MKVTFLTAAGILSFLLGASSVRAEDEKNTKAQGQESTKNVGVMSPQQNDVAIARWLGIDNQMVIDCAKLGESQATNKEVKDFATQLVADHTKCMEDCKKKFSSTNNDTNNDNATEAKPAVVITNDGGASRDGRVFYRPTNFVDVKESVYKELKSKAEEQFKALKGAQFDEAFIKHQVMAHECILANIKVVRKNASKELAKDLDVMSEQLTSHLNRAKEISKTVTTASK